MYTSAKHVTKVAINQHMIVFYLNTVKILKHLLSMISHKVTLAILQVLMLTLTDNFKKTKIDYKIHFYSFFFFFRGREISKPKLIILIPYLCVPQTSNTLAL